MIKKSLFCLIAILAGLLCGTDISAVTRDWRNRRFWSVPTSVQDQRLLRKLSAMFPDTNTVSVTWVQPPPANITNWITTNSLGQPIATNGQTITMTVDASSLAAPISRIEWYDVWSNSLTHVLVTNLIAKTNILQPPLDFRMAL